MARKISTRNTGLGHRNKIIDPVCGMEADPTINMRYRGKTFFFCSESCKDQFEDNSDSFLG